MAKETTKKGYIDWVRREWHVVKEMESERGFDSYGQYTVPKGRSMVPNAENVKLLVERFENAKERVAPIIEKEIDPIYFDLAEKVGGWVARESKYAPWILARQMTVEEAKVVFALPDEHRDPSWGKESLGVTEQFAKDLGMDKEAVDKILRGLEKKGCVNPTRKGYQGPRGSHHFTHGFYYVDKDPALVDMCWIFGRLEEQQAREKLVEAAKASGRKFPGWAMIPRWKAIKDIPGVLPVENMMEIFKAHRRFALLHCSCRDDDPERQCDTPIEVCFSFDRGADATVANGSGKELTLAEALDWYDSLAQYPVVTLLMGGAAAIHDPKEIRAMCNCHWDCCLAMMPWYMPYSNYSITDFIMKTRFRATVDPEKCIGCGKCNNERCQFFACDFKYYPEFGEERAYVDEEKCAGCGCCVETCTAGARSMKVVAGPEYLLEIGEDEGVNPKGAAQFGVESTLELWAQLDKEKKLAEEKKP